MRAHAQVGENHIEALRGGKLNGGAETAVDHAHGAGGRLGETTLSHREGGRVRVHGHQQSLGADASGKRQGMARRADGEVHDPIAWPWIEQAEGLGEHHRAVQRGGNVGPVVIVTLLGRAPSCHNPCAALREPH